MVPKILPVVVVCAPPKIVPVLAPKVVGCWPNPGAEVAKGELNPFEVPPKLDPKVFVADWPNEEVVAIVVEENIDELDVDDANTGCAPDVATEPNIEGCVAALVAGDVAKKEPWLVEP